MLETETGQKRVSSETGQFLILTHEGAKARQRRVDSPGAIYYPLALQSSPRDKRHERRREPTLRDDAERQSRECGIETLTETCAKTGLAP